MIIGRSKDPVTLKKIPLRLWTLKDEISATLSYYSTHLPDQLEEVKEYYQSSQTQVFAKAAEEKIPEGEIDENEEADAAENNVVNIHTGAPSVQMTQEQCQKTRTRINRIIPPKQNISHGHLFLFDVNMNEVLLFSDRTYKPGQAIVIEVSIDHGFTLKGEVDYVKNVGIKSRIITEHPPHYRIRCFWTLDHPGDRTLLRKFLSSLKSDSNLRSGRNANTISQGEDEVIIDEGDDFDLGDLGGL